MEKLKHIGKKISDQDEKFESRKENISDCMGFLVTNEEASDEAPDKLIPNEDSIKSGK
jgi:hypothetical protein